MIKDLPSLRRILIKYLEDVEQIKLFAERKGIDLDEIGWKNAPVFIWNKVMELLKDQHLPLLLENVQSLNLDNEVVVNLENEIHFQRNKEQALDGIQLDYQKMGVLDTINCGRSLEAKDFWKAEQIKPSESQLLTGIVSGTISQNPRSLAERLALEFLDDMEAEDKAVLYQRGGISGKLRPLRISANTEVLIHNTIDEYLETVTDNRELTQYGVIAHLVEVDIEASKDVLFKIFDIVYQRLKAFCKEKEVLNLLLLVYPYSASFDAANLNHHLLTKSEKQHDVKYYRVTSNVKQHEITNWFNDCGSVDVEDIHGYLSPFIEFGLDEEDQNGYKQKHSLPMHFMEKVQHQIFKYVMKEGSENNSHDYGP